MTTDLPKVNIFQTPRVSTTNMRFGGVTFGGSTHGGQSTTLKKDLDEISSYGANKARAEQLDSSGLNGASTPCEGTGKHIWTYC